MAHDKVISYLTQPYQVSSPSFSRRPAVARPGRIGRLAVHGAAAVVPAIGNARAALASLPL